MELPRLINVEIRVKGHLGETLLAGFPGLLATRRNGETLLTGTLRDLSELYGTIAQIEALGLELVAVRRDAPDDEAD